MAGAARIVESIREAGSIGIIRVRSSQDLLRGIEALRDGGMSCVEITMNTPGGLEALEEASAAFPDLVLGAGTVLDEADAEDAMSAGAQYIVTPVMSVEVITAAKRGDCAIISGAMTPTESFAAWRAGADIVKVFPAEVLGPAFFRAMRGPLPEILLAPTGGISAETAPAYIRAGAAVVCAGSWLINERSVAAEDYPQITARARALCDAIREARQELDAG